MRLQAGVEVVPTRDVIVERINSEGSSFSPAMTNGSRAQLIRFILQGRQRDYDEYPGATKTTPDYSRLTINADGPRSIQSTQQDCDT